MATEDNQHPAHAQILEILELQRITQENKKKAEELKAESARLEQAIADIKINPLGIQRINTVVTAIKALETCKATCEAQAQNKPGLSDLCTEVDISLQYFKGMPKVKRIFDWLRQSIETHGDINDILDDGNKIDWYGLSGMPDLQPKE